ncbi:MAG: hypothetical protein IT223_12250 [Crocinitomicaceae bacterium]|nr:hypothetical protein [Crocinitomicaceae bacterium]
MKKTISTLSFLFLIGLTAFSQSLTFGSALIISNTPSTVPTGKVWKITGAFGIGEGCIGNYNSAYGTIRYKKTNYTAFFVDGTEVPVEFFLKSIEHYGASDCTGSSSTGDQSYFLSNASWSKVPSTTVFPMWVPAGTVVNTNGSTVKISVLEFNVVP